MGGGYRDLNINIEFEGLVCEIQIHIREFFDLKAGAHPCYERCRYLGLVGELPETESGGDNDGFVRVTDTKMPTGIRVTLIFMRWFVGSFSAGCATAYIPFMHYYEMILPSERELWFRIVLSFALVTVPSIISFLTTRDMLRGLSHRQAVVAVAFGVVFWPCLGFLGGIDEELLVMTGVAFAYLLHVAAAAASLRWGAGRKRKTRSRVAMLYDRYLGIDGQFFVWKVLAMQSFTILLQAPAKLPTLGAAVWLSGASGHGTYNSALKPFFWLFLGALVVNALYPSFLLRCKNMMLQRDACAAFDAVLDLLYFTTFQLSTYFVSAYGQMTPVSAYEYLSSFWPLLHIYTVAQALEAAAIRRHAEASAAAKRRGSRKASRRMSLDGITETAHFIFEADAKVAGSRLPFWAAVAYALSMLGFIGMVLLTQCGTDRYPFGDWNHPCRPCVCDSVGLLVSCAVPAELKIYYLSFIKQKITGIKPGAFTGNDHLVAGIYFLTNSLDAGSSFGYHSSVPYVPRASISTLPPGAFDGLENMRDFLDMTSLNISTIEHGAFGALRRLETLSLRNNQLVKLSSGAFDGLRSLRLLFLDDNKIDYLESNALRGSRDLEAVWVPGNRINCTHVEEAGGLDRDATCIDSASCEYKSGDLHSMGDGRCYDIYDNYECAWDGGDCDAKR